MTYWLLANKNCKKNLKRISAPAKWKAAADHNPIKSYWVQQNILIVRVSWQMFQERPNRCTLQQVLGQLHGGSLGCHLDINKTLDMVKQRHYWLHGRHSIEMWSEQWHPCSPPRSLNPYQGFDELPMTGHCPGLPRPVTEWQPAATIYFTLLDFKKTLSRCTTDPDQKKVI
jgi:hypothetical protein